MLHGIREIRRLTKDIEKTKPKVYDEEGRVTVDISVSDDSDCLSPYSTANEPHISSDFADFLYHSVKHTHPNEKLHFKVKSDVISDTEKQIYPEAIKNYYTSEFIECSRDMRKNTFFSLIMTVLAALVFTVAIILEGVGVESVVLSMIDVVAWVFMWEAVDLFVLERSAIKLKRARLLSLIRAKYSFN